MKTEKIKVLFICADNSIRSQMAAAFLNANFGDRYEAYCAGIEPAEVNPYAIKVMKEIGIDIFSSRTKGIEEFKGNKFDCIITLCDHAKKSCRCLPEHRKCLHKNFEAYCETLVCDFAKKPDTCSPRPVKRRYEHPGDLDGRGVSEGKILSIFRCLREEIFEWVEKEAVF